ncbi:hypothetical protein RIU14_01250 [Riemerella anatipestifer]|uniref:hypothetical protein n=1 Tax=Riemerella anatipestifer TaxID=34085 RepID=UPI00069945F0|nr:hypothetical protein [Riemerella anatipestifer]MDR7693399.1 hypothetical protein [Riemerella anatipestifer]
MKRAIFPILLLTSHIVLTSSGGKPTPPWEKENVSFPMMNQEIRHSMQEHDRQVEMKNKQHNNLGTEVVNKKQWSKFKQTTAKIQDRLRLVDFALQAIPTGIVISREAKEIEKNQQRILEEIKTAPYAIVVALPKQIEFVDDLQMVVRLLTGIVVSYGAINQMERAERKILLDYALSEVERLNSQSFFLLTTIRNTKEKFERNKSLLGYYINADRQIVEDIINNVKTF